MFWNIVIGGFITLCLWTAALLLLLWAFEHRPLAIDRCINRFLNSCISCWWAFPLGVREALYPSGCSSLACWAWRYSSCFSRGEATDTRQMTTTSATEDRRCAANREIS